MAGFQFAHMQTYSQKGNSKNRSSTDVLLENSRVPGNAPHVENAEPPNLIYGNDPADAIELINQRFELSKVHLRGTGQRIQANTHVLNGAVFSHPTTTAQLKIADEATRQDYLKWRQLSCEFAIKDAERMGLEVVSIVEHLDESHPHIHVLSIPKVDADNPRMDIKRRHVGHSAAKSAYDATLEANLEEGIPRQQALKSATNASTSAFKKAMRTWQDSYYNEVAIKCGQARFGPKRARLSRPLWVKAQRNAEQLVELENKVKLTKGELKQYRDAIGDINSLCSENEQLSNDVDKLANENQSLSKENDALKSVLSDLKLKHEQDLNSMRDKATKEIRRLTDELDQHRPRYKR